METGQTDIYQSLEAMRMAKAAYAGVVLTPEQSNSAFRHFLQKHREAVPRSLEILAFCKAHKVKSYPSMKSRLKFFIHFLNKNRSGARGAYQSYKALAQDELDDVVLGDATCGLQLTFSNTRGLRTIEGDSEIARYQAAYVENELLTMEWLLQIAPSAYWK